MAGVVGAYRQERIDGVSPSNTSIDIGKIVIERNLQPRRKLKRTHTETDIFEIEVDTCCFANCDNPAVTEAFYNSEARKLCDKHVKLLTESGSTAWRFF